jgi:hypothetical protein
VKRSAWQQSFISEPSAFHHPFCRVEDKARTNFSLLTQVGGRRSGGYERYRNLCCKGSATRTASPFVLCFSLDENDYTSSSLYLFLLPFHCMPLCLPWNTKYRREVTVMTGKRDKADEKRARNFLESFKALSLAGQSKSTTTTDKPDIVDGRAPRRAQGYYAIPGSFAPSSPPPHLPSSPNPPPPPHLNNAAAAIPPPPVLYSRMPVPRKTSLTMQYAITGSLPPQGVLATPPRVPITHRPVVGPSYSTTELGLRTPVPRPASGDLPTPPPLPPSLGHSRTPQPPKLQPAPPLYHRRARSEPLSPPPPPATPPSDVGKETRQCCGITAAGKRCRKQVKASGAQAHTDCDVFCHVHANKVGEPSGFYDRKTGQTFVEFQGELRALPISFPYAYMRTCAVRSHDRE